MAKHSLPGAIKNERDLASAALALAESQSLESPELELAQGGQLFDRIFLREISQAIRAGEDPLGGIFQDLRPAPARRQQGAIYTPPPIVEAMVEWAAKAGEFDRVVDPGAGSGRFLLAAGMKFPNAELVADEIDALARLLLRANLTQRGLIHRARILAEDY
jgi:methylase of polypeptide subunit release factors